MIRLGTLAVMLAVAGGAPAAANDAGQDAGQSVLLTSSPKPMPRPTDRRVTVPDAVEVAPVPLPEATAEPVSAPAAPLQDALLPADPTAKPLRDPNKGPVTNMPLPRFVTLKSIEGNARRGPGLTHRIDWVFTRAGMPLRLTAEFENWRRVEDADGVGGWIHYSLLSGVRSVLIMQDMAEFHGRADPASDVAFQAELGVIGKLLKCDPDWCRVSVQGEKGWVPKTALWGVEPGEIIE